MNRADEKRAFDLMMGEISDSDSDGEQDDSRKTAYSSASSPKSASPIPYKNGTVESSRTSAMRRSEMIQEDEEIENFGCRSSGPIINQKDDQINTMKRWLTRPCAPDDPPVMCYVERHRDGFSRINPTYKCYLEGSDGQGPRFLMAAKKKTGSKTSYYLISTDIDHQDDRGSESVLGKVRGNSVGSQYLITDHGIAPDKTVAPSMLRKELGLVRFEFDSGGPSRIEAFIPTVHGTCSACTWQPTSEDQGMGVCIDELRLNNLLSLVNKKPKWDDAHGGHVLNFQGRVTESSVKNFQLCPVNTLSSSGSGSSSGSTVVNDDVVLQFGRVAKHKFTLDVRFPMSPMQAFAISVACMDGKIADRKGYEYLRKIAGGTESATSNSQAKGSVAGSKSFRGSIAESIPSSQYLKDKMSRAFK